jgi:hypothetical protein
MGEVSIHMNSATGFQHIDYQCPAVFAVLEGVQAGRVFVDRHERPSVALIWSAACYLTGGGQLDKNAHPFYNCVTVLLNIPSIL